MEPRISLVTLGVRDLPRAVRFYRDGLGWPLSSVGDDDVAFFRTGGIVLSLFRRHLLAADAQLPEEGTGFGGIVLAHNVRSKELVDAALAEVVAAGGTILRPAQDAFWGGYYGHFADPESYPWEVAWNPGFPLAEDGTVEIPE